MKDCFHLKLFWISSQKEYTEAIVKKQLELSKKPILLWKVVFPQNYLEDRINGCGQERGLKVES